MGKKKQNHLYGLVDSSLNLIAKHLVNVIADGQGKLGYIDTQVPRGKAMPKIWAYYDLQNGSYDEQVVVGVRVRDGIIEFIAEPSSCVPTYSEEDFNNNENWNGDLINGNYLYYETIINIANYIEEYIK